MPNMNRPFKQHGTALLIVLTAVLICDAAGATRQQVAVPQQRLRRNHIVPEGFAAASLVQQASNSAKSHSKLPALGHLVDVAIEGEVDSRVKAFRAKIEAGTARKAKKKLNEAAYHVERLMRGYRKHALMASRKWKSRYQQEISELQTRVMRLRRKTEMQKAARQKSLIEKGEYQKQNTRLKQKLTRLEEISLNSAEKAVTMVLGKLQLGTDAVAKERPGIGELTIVDQPAHPHPDASPQLVDTGKPPKALREKKSKTKTASKKSLEPTDAASKRALEGGWAGTTRWTVEKAPQKQHQGVGTQGLKIMQLTSMADGAMQEAITEKRLMKKAKVEAHLAMKKTRALLRSAEQKTASLQHRKAARREAEIELRNVFRLTKVSTTAAQKAARAQRRQRRLADEVALATKRAHEGYKRTTKAKRTPVDSFLQTVRASEVEAMRAVTGLHNGLQSGTGHAQELAHTGADANVKAVEKVHHWATTIKLVAEKEAAAAHQERKTKVDAATSGMMEAKRKARHLFRSQARKAKKALQTAKLDVATHLKNIASSAISLAELTARFYKSKAKVDKKLRGIRAHASSLKLQTLTKYHTLRRSIATAYARSKQAYLTRVANVHRRYTQQKHDARESMLTAISGGQRALLEALHSKYSGLARDIAKATRVSVAKQPHADQKFQFQSSTPLGN